MKLSFIATSCLLVTVQALPEPGIGNPTIMNQRLENIAAREAAIERKRWAARDKDHAHILRAEDKHEARQANHAEKSAKISGQSADALAQLAAVQANFLWKRNVIRGRLGMAPCATYDDIWAKTCPGDVNA